MRSEIPFIRPRFPLPIELAQDFDEISHANWYTNFGPMERRFAHALADYLGPDVYVATFANGTLALVAAIRAAIGAGTQVQHLLMPSFTFVAVAEAAMWAGYRPWFIDIDPDTWQPSVASARVALTSARDDIAGILVANVFGVGNPQIAEWEELAAEWNLPLVIDSAAGFGSRYHDGELVGRRGACEIFSFHTTKPFAIGEGGALATRSPEFVTQANDFANFGFTTSRECNQLGLNAKLQEVNAAIGLRQLADFDQRLASRRQVFERYRVEFAGLGLQLQPNAEGASLCFVGVQCDSPRQKQSILASLNAHAIQARDYYNPPQHLHPYFEANSQLVRSTELSATLELCSRIVSIPVHDHMPSRDVDRIIAAVRDGGE